MADTLYADVSEWQVGVNDSYPYPVLCIRSNDGTHRDRRWVNNYGWCLRNADSGRLTFFIVYFVWRPNWQQTVDTFKDRAEMEAMYESNRCPWMVWDDERSSAVA